jgi:hypothetical protein
MKKGYINYLLFILMILLGLIQAISGFLLWRVIPGGGYQGGRGTFVSDNSFLGDRNAWISIHDWTAVALVVIVMIHIILHWNWILSTTKKMLGRTN